MRDQSRWTATLARLRTAGADVGRAAADWWGQDTVGGRAGVTGIHVQTAVAWTRLTGRDWTNYVATRAHDTAATPGPSLQR